MKRKSRGAELLRLYRKARGLSQAGLAQYLIGPRQWATAMIQAWETGRCAPTRRRQRILERLTRGQVAAAAWHQPAEYQLGEQLSLLAPPVRWPVLLPQPCRPGGTTTCGAQA